MRAREPADVIAIAAADLAPFRNLMVNDEVAKAPHHNPIRRLPSLCISMPYGRG